MSSPSRAVVRAVRPSDGERRIDDCFREQARLFPDATAVVDGDRWITYGELHERAVAVARGLVARGVGRETPVATAFERSAEAVVAMLGILLAGGAYVPL
ncbi:AMP-binding protein, partial [Streptomyces sp. W16]|uniref:AMP-binding protein n=1 Tax=Streptomyces sp. W16 TaxID=3076631 RepID=UPI00295AB1CC